MHGYLGLGSNVGDRKLNLSRALTELRQSQGVEVRAVSSLYETEPVGEVLNQRSFYNAAVQIESELKPFELLALCKGIECRLGRSDRGRHGPREIDIDILLIDCVSGEFSGQVEGLGMRKLVLPHPGLLERRFVLIPLLELNPDLAHPSGKSLAEALLELGSGQSIKKL